MIRGIGIDSIEIDRFEQWNQFTPKQLARIFCAQEITYCRTVPEKSAERFAIRFAAREAFFKALNPFIHPKTISFLTVCKAIKINRASNGMPQLMFNWNILNKLQKHPQPAITIHLSLTHTTVAATAFVLLEQR